MQRFKYIFVVVIYRNGEDLYKLDKSIRNFINDYKIVVVNSFFNNETMERIIYICNELNCDFINIKNKGYGYGNNTGIEYINNTYKYDYLVISNSDVEIEKFDEKKISLIKRNSIIGPKIKTLHNKNQNPYQVIYSKILDKLYYQGYKHNCKIILYCAIAINKIIRSIYIFINIFNKSNIKVYALHGAFIIFTNDVIKKLYPFYDEKMFLYNEERLLAYKSMQADIDCYVCTAIQVLHKEDGSTRGMKFDEYKYIKESYKYFYENYVIRKDNQNEK